MSDLARETTVKGEQMVLDANGGSNTARSDWWHSSRSSF
jgi:hypothetical protein